MGLLDGLGGSMDDPRTMGLLTLGLGLLANKERNFGAALGGAGMNAMGAYRGAQADALRRQMMESQLEENRAQADQRRAAMADAQRRAEQQQRLSGYLQSSLLPSYAPGSSIMKPDTMVPQRTFDPATYVALGGSIEDAQKLAGAPTWGMPEVARTVEVDDGRGGKATKQLDKFGRPVGEAMPGYVAPVQVNQGGQITFAKPQAGVSLPVGMSPSERDASARGWANVALQRQQAAEGGKPPPGYRWKPDGALEAIPGGPADIKATAEGQKAELRKQLAGNAADGVLATVKEAKDLIGVTTTGPGALLAKLPATDARNLQAKLETVKANLGFDRLQQMREASPTGGALGAVAVQELVALQSTVASLDQMQSPQQLTRALEKIELHYSNWLNTVRGTQKATPTGLGTGQFKFLGKE